MNNASPTSHSFISQRLKLHYVDWGNPDAPPLILQHGGRDHCRSWDWAAQQLRHDWHVMCPDLRGHGDSAWSPDGDYSATAYVYDFAQFVHNLGYDQVSIVGHSLGGNITTRYAGVYPEKVRKLVNIEGLGFTPKVVDEREHKGYGELLRELIEARRNAAGRLPRRYNTLAEAYARMKEENSYLTEEQARHLTIHGTSRNEDGTFSWKFDNYLHAGWPIDAPFEEIRKVWQNIECEVLLLWGKDSFFSSPGEDGRMDNLRFPHLIEYENAGHWLQHDQFDRFMRDVTAFLAD